MWLELVGRLHSVEQEAEKTNLHYLKKVRYGLCSLNTSQRLLRRL